MKPIYKKVVFWQAFIPYVAQLAFIVMIELGYFWSGSIIVLLPIFFALFYPIVSIIWSLVYVICRVSKKRFKSSDMITMIISTASLWLTAALVWAVICE